MSDAHATVAFATKLLGLLDQGRFTTTYKHAVLLALLDLCIENVAADGTPPEVITTRQLAEKVLQLYWHQSYDFRPLGRMPDQNGSKRATAILAKIRHFQDHHPRGAYPSLFRARQNTPDLVARLIRDIEEILILWPLARLQIAGGRDDRFLYEIAWTRADTDSSAFKKRVRAYLKGDGTALDNTIRFKRDASAHLVMLSALIRPLVQRHWAAKVAGVNALVEADLEHFLFDAGRESLSSLTEPLREHQRGHCFYCHHALSDRGGSPEVDHFIPRSRHPNDAVDNLVLAHRSCNNAKRDFLADQRHVQKWLERAHDDRILDQLASDGRWYRDSSSTLGTARAIYLNLPPKTPLWVATHGRESRFAPSIPDALAQLFA